MKKGQRNVFSVNASKAIAKVQVTEQDIKEKYGWSEKPGLCSSVISGYQKFLISLSSLGLLLIAVLCGFGKFDLGMVVSGLAVEPIYAKIMLGALLLVVVETVYEFIAVRGQYKRPNLLEVYGYKVIAGVGAVVLFALSSVIAILAIFGVIVYGNYSRTVVQRKKNFEEYLKLKMEEVAANAALPAKQQKEVSYAKVEGSIGVVSPDEDLSGEVTV